MKRSKNMLAMVITALLLILILAVPVSAAGKISKSKATLVTGQKMQLKLSGIKGKIKWSSSKKSVAAVSSKGVVTAKKKGSATITAKVGKKKYTCKVAVEAPRMNKQMITLNVKKSVTLKLTGTKQKIKWSSSNKNVATVNKKGKVTAKNVGSADIVATVGGMKYVCRVIVAGKGTVPVVPVDTPIPVKPTEVPAEPTKQPVQPTQAPEPTAIPQPTKAPVQPTEVPKPTSTPVPTATPIPTNTPVPTAIPQPTNTPEPIRATRIYYTTDSRYIGHIGETEYVAPLIYPMEAYSTTGNYIELTSSDETVLKIVPGSSQYAVALKAGTATITARTTDGTNLSASCVFTVMNYYDITYVYNDTTNRSYTYSSRPGTIIYTSGRTCSRDGYLFEGWYTEAEGGQLVTSFTLDDNIKLYAHWSKNDSAENAINVFLEGEETYKCIISGEMVSADIDVSAIEFEIVENNDVIGNFYYKYHEYSNSFWVSFRAQRAGRIQVLAKYNGITLKKWNIIVTVDWANYVGYVNWRHSIESQIWTNNMSLKEKMDAAKEFIKSHFGYQNGASEIMNFYNDTVLDCYGATDLMSDFAKDTGGQVKYVNAVTGHVFDYSVDAFSEGGHVYDRILIDGNWVNYDATPQHS